jgi:MFS family permease
MNSQNTPVHIRLWHHDFWRMAIANLLLTMAVYVLVPTLPQWLLQTQDFTSQETGLSMGVFGIGLFTFGGFVSFLVQHYRRNTVCLAAVLAMVGLFGLIYYAGKESGFYAELSLMLFQRFALGACFGLAQMVLTSTLVIDVSESYQRTEANYAAAWFGRFALSLGPLAGLILLRIAGFQIVLLAAAFLAAAALLLVFLVNFPFRAPMDDLPIVSLDRFFLPHGVPLFLNLQLIMLAVGLLLSLSLTEQFYAMMMVGFLMAILAQRFVFRDAEVKSEVVSGLILMAAALLMMLTRTQQIVSYAAPAFVGLGLGIIGSRFLLFFIKLSRHCKRGTSQSTFMLGWESGIAWGLGLGYALFEGEQTPILLTALGLVLVSLLLYNFVHNWFVSNKNR